MIYFEHQGSEIARGINLVKLIALMRARKFQRIWILDRTIRPALAAMLAGIPERIGPGDGLQRRLITNAGIDPRHFRELAMDWLRVLLELMNVPVTSTEPDLKLPEKLLAGIAARYQTPRPWIVLALGGSHPSKDWPDAHSAALLDSLRRRTPGTVFLIGGADNAVRAQALIARSAGVAPAVNACDLSILEAAALLRLADLFVGPELRADEPCRRRRDAGFHLVRRDPGAELFALHPRDRARGRAVAGRNARSRRAR